MHVSKGPDVRGAQNAASQPDAPASASPQSTASTVGDAPTGDTTEAQAPVTAAVCVTHQLRTVPPHELAAAAHEPEPKLFVPHQLASQSATENSTMSAKPHPKLVLASQAHVPQLASAGFA